jgi:Predicted membrane protein
MPADKIVRLPFPNAEKLFDLTRSSKRMRAEKSAFNRTEKQLFCNFRNEMESFLFIIEVLALLAFAYSGVVEARRSGFDYVGVLTVAFVTAFGGGTIRDVLLDRHPLYWIEHWQFLVYILVFSAVASVLLLYNKDFSSNKTLMLIDALGLGLFCASGVGIAIDMQIPVLPAVFIGVVTATFGGVLRDVLCSRKPQIFQPTEPLYATCAFAGAWVCILLRQFGVAPAPTLIACIVVTFLFRVSAVRFNLKLPLLSQAEVPSK